MPPSKAWERDRAKAERFAPQAMEIAARCLPRRFDLASARVDQTQATDLVEIQSGPVCLAFRCRDHDYLRQFRNEVTIREDRPSGVKCEWDKIFEDGYATHYLYSFANHAANDGAGLLIGWRMLRLDALRRQVRQALGTLTVKHKIPNHDGSSTFAAIDVRSMHHSCQVATEGLEFPQQLVCTRTLHFADSDLQEGTVVPCMEPTEAEARGGRYSGGLADDERNDATGSPWGVVLWNGTRRRVPMRCFVRADGIAAEVAHPPMTPRKPRPEAPVRPRTAGQLVEGLTGVDPDEMRQPRDDVAMAILTRRTLRLVPGELGWALHGDATLGERQLLVLWMRYRSDAAVAWMEAQRRRPEWDDLHTRRAEVQSRIGRGNA